MRSFLNSRTGFISSTKHFQKQSPLFVNFSDSASEKVLSKPDQYNVDRARWREQVSVLRKQYAEEDAARKEEARQRKLALATDIAIKKAENMKKKMARSAVTAKRVAIERQAQTAKFEEHVKAMDQVRSERKHDEDARLRTMVNYLEEQSKLWLSPEKLDKELNESFINESGKIIGHCEERSPYWGYVADVEDIKELIAQIYNGVVPDLTEEKPEPMAIAHDYMVSSSRNYREYKLIRESEGDIDGFLNMFKETEFQQSEPAYYGNTHPIANDPDMDEFESPSSRDGDVDENGDRFPSRNLGGGMIGRFAKKNLSNMDDNDEQKITEQLARLRARRSRPTPSDPPSK